MPSSKTNALPPKSKMIMKTKLILIFLLLAMSAQAQIELTLMQDLKLATTADDAGNEPFTLDLKTYLRFYNKGSKHQWLHNSYAGISYEYANLYGGDYTRYAMGLGYTFNFTKRFNGTIGGDLGQTIRWGGSMFSWELQGDLSYKLTKNFSLTAAATLVSRPDLKERWGTQEPTYSGFVGVKYYINHTSNQSKYAWRR